MSIVVILVSLGYVLVPPVLVFLVVCWNDRMRKWWGLKFIIWMKWREFVIRYW